MGSNSAAELLRMKSGSPQATPSTSNKSAFRFSAPPSTTVASRSASLPPLASTSSASPLAPKPDLPNSETKKGSLGAKSKAWSPIPQREAKSSLRVQASTSKQPGSSDAQGKGKGKAFDEPDIAKSLLSRLSGPSDNKAGLTRDPEEVKRIIYEASKGSKYFQKQQKDDAELTIKVDIMVAKLEEMVQAKRGDLRAEERKVDQMIKELEKTRDLSETIVVVDADAFYASCHQREDPSLEGIPFAVGGGVLTTASYAARAYGCRSAMAGFVAKKLCPHLKFIDLDFSLYTKCSRDIMDILREFGVISPASLDEAYCSLTEYVRKEECTPTEAGDRMRAAVLAKTGLTVSAGVTPNAMLSKIAADINKPNGQYVVDPTREAVMSFTKDLPIRKVPGIGRVSERVLQSVGVMKVGDVYALRGKLFLIQKQIGLTFLLRAYLGLGGTVITPAQRGERKTYGREDTFGNLSDTKELSRKLRALSNQLGEDLSSAQFSGRTVTLKIKYDTYQTFTRARTLGSNIYFMDADTIFSEASKLLDKEILDYRKKHNKVLTLRLLGVRMSNLRDEMMPEGKDKSSLSGWTQKASATSTSSSKVKTSQTFRPMVKTESLPVKRELDGDWEEDDDDIIIVDENDEVDNDAEEAHVSSPSKQPASSDPLWAAFDGDERDDTYLADLELEAEKDKYKPMWKAGEGLNSKVEIKMPVPMEDRLSFGTVDDAEDGESGGMKCPVCEVVFQGSEAGLSAHVASHFDNDGKPPKKKHKLSSSSADASQKSRKGKKGTGIQSFFSKQ